MSLSPTPIIDAIDMEILMHRDAHFGKNFQVMMEYYEHQGVGVMPDFEMQAIKRLRDLERQIGKDLSTFYLPESAKKIVKKSQELYASLRDAYKSKDRNELSPLISDLILSEEVVPKKPIKALIDQKTRAVPSLIHLITSPSFYEPISPGYGRTPIFAAQCLAMIQDVRAIPPLFEALGQDNFFTDEEIIYALKSFGSRAEAFLLQRLKAKPLSKDNEHAAIALSGFPETQDIAKSCLHLLQDSEVLRRPSFANYLIFICSALTQLEDRDAFRQILKSKETPKALKEEIRLIIKNWEDKPPALNKKQG